MMFIQVTKSLLLVECYGHCCNDATFDSWLQPGIYNVLEDMTEDVLGGRTNNEGLAYFNLEGMGLVELPARSWAPATDRGLLVGRRGAALVMN
jgi:hypothetical protein